MSHQERSLQSFQQYLAERIKTAESQDQQQYDRRLGVLLGELFFLIPLTDIKEILPTGIITRVPLTQPWFLGLRNVSGRLIGVIDYVYFAHGIRQSVASDSRILIPTMTTLEGCGFIVSAVIGICDVKTMTKGSLTENGQARVIYIDQEQRQWREVNWPILMQMPAFFQVSL